ncbi:MAG TPA: hypothetical protein PK939_04355 [Bacteroidales bacterium]|nr:hypothetical protein [Bacteroidales bacterium]HQQ12373.1 hypothetical protein [Bacteroidales bacterium]
MANNLSDEISNLTADLKMYLNLRLNLIGLLLSKRIATLSSILLTVIIITGLASMIILMLSFAFVFWFGHHVGTYYQGFLVMAGVYTLLGVIVFLGRKKFFVDPVIHKINEKMTSADFAGTSTPSPAKFANLDDHINYLTQVVEKHEADIQKDYENITEQLQPANLLKNAVGSLLTSPTLLITLLNLAIKVLRKGGKNKEENNEESDG